MSNAVAALIPVAVLIALGFLLRRSGFIAGDAWPPIERLVYVVCFPALLFSELARAPLAGLPILAFGGTLLLTQLAMAGVAMGMRRGLALPGPAYTSVLQCVVRWNSYVAVALAPLVMGPSAAPLAALAVAIMVPTANVIAVAALARHGTATKAGSGGFLLAVVTNPLLLASALGLTVNVTGLTLPMFLAEPLTMLGRATLPLGLLAVGAGLRLGAFAEQPLVIVLATAAKLIAKPVVAVLIGGLLGMDGLTLSVVALVAGVPTATSAYILARLLGGDAELMAALVTTTTLASLLTLPLVLTVLG